MSELVSIRNVGDLRRLIDGQGDDVPVRVHFGIDLAIAESGFDEDDGAVLLFADSDAGVSPVNSQWLRSLEDERRRLNRPSGARLATAETGEAEVFINTLRYVVAPGGYTGLDVRRFMHPPLTLQHDLYLDNAVGDDTLIADDDTITVKDGLRFYSAPRFINEG